MGEHEIGHPDAPGHGLPIERLRILIEQCEVRKLAQDWNVLRAPLGAAACRDEAEEQA
jgi:hypothetical protein